jgi:hypothetical protein
MRARLRRARLIFVNANVPMSPVQRQGIAEVLSFDHHFDLTPGLVRHG